MIFKSVAPKSSLKHLVREFWIFENADSTVEVQKIIPDGYSEIIIHYGDTYRINMNGKWKDQSRLLFSSQISRFFFLENTGRSGMIGIKLFPYAFYHLFGINLAPYTDRVISLSELEGVDFTELEALTDNRLAIEDRISIIEKWFNTQLTKRDLYDVSLSEKAVTRIFQTNGLTDVNQISEELDISTRQLERSFKKSIGVSPKFFSRIIRFNHIFQVMEKGNDSWIRIALESGYFDQSHFIKNFKEFTGEEPSKYGFEASNLANFFLKK